YTGLPLAPLPGSGTSGGRGDPRWRWVAQAAERGNLLRRDRRGLRSQEIAMLFYRDHVYPHLVSMLGNPKPIREVRQRIVPLAQGIVLEIGVGPGVNFRHYDPARVSKLYALEPNPGMVRLAETHRRRTKLNVELLDLPGERIPLEAGSVDTVVSTF